MKRYTLGMCAMLLAFMLGPPGKLKADDVSMTLVGVSQSLGDYYIAPYEISVGGTTYSLICDDAYDEITMGESWKATTETFSNPSGALFSGASYTNPTTGTATDLTQAEAYQVAGYLAQEIMANISSTVTAGEYQYALWDLFDPGFSLTAGVSDYENQIEADLSAAVSACGSAGSCSYSDTIYTPSPKEQGEAQEFLLATAPEPMTLWSLLVVLAAIALACKRMDKTTVKSSALAGR